MWPVKKFRKNNIFDPQNRAVHRLATTDRSSLEWRYTDYSWNEYGPGRDHKLKTRVGIYYGLILVLVGIFFLRLANLQIARGYGYRLQAEGNHIRSRLVEAPRGNITDRHGSILASNTADYSLFIYPYNMPRSVSEQQETVARIVSVTGYQGDLAAEIKQARARGFEPLELFINLDRDRAITWKIQLPDVPAVNVSAQPKRYYQTGLPVAHIIGYTGKMNDDEISRYPDYPSGSEIGKTGIEYSYDIELRGRAGEERVEIDSAGLIRRFIDTLTPVTGNTLQLALDNGLQQVLADNLRLAMEKTQSKSAVAIAMDPRNGGIISLVSLPDYDPNIFAGSVNPEQYQALLDNPDKSLLNRAIAGVYPPGSTIKPFVATGALEAGVIGEQTTLITPPEIKIGEWVFPDWKAHGSANVKKAIAESNNVFFYTIGGGYGNIGGLGSSRLGRYLEQYGFAAPTGIDLPGEKKGLVPSPEWKEKYKKEKWYIGDTYHMAIGQGDILVTPMEIAAATAAVANGGTFYEPKVGRAVIAPDGQKVRDIAPTARGAAVASADNLRIVREGMRQTITAGSGRSTFGDGFPVAVAGKTGTAQFGSEGKLHAWFTSFAPFNDPKIVITVFVEGGGEGYMTAAPVAKAAYEWYAAHIEALE